MKAYMFPGMGSQFLGMGRELFPLYPELTAQASELLGLDIRRACLEDPDRQLSSAQVAQPLLHVVNCLSLLRLAQQDEAAPDVVLGHSLGELAALFAAGVFNFEVGVRLALERARLMSVVRGGMLAVSGVTATQLIEYVHPDDGVDFANLNSAQQTVLSGPDANIRALYQRLKGVSGAALFPLRVDAASHSRYMRDSAARLADYLRTLPLAAPKFVVIANATAQPYEKSRLVETLSAQLCSSVRWHESIVRLLRTGVSEFVEVGPGRRLSELVAQIRGEPAPAKASWVAYANLNSASRPHEARAVAPPPLGSTSFCQRYDLKAPYAAGSMQRGISSAALVIRMARAGMLSFFGSAQLPTDQVDRALREIRDAAGGRVFGCHLGPRDGASSHPELVQLLLRHQVPCVEVSGFRYNLADIVWYRASGLTLRAGALQVAHRVLAKVSHPELAEPFLRPPSDQLLRSLVSEARITPEQAELAATGPLADDLCMEVDSGAHTVQRSPLAWFGALRGAVRACRERYGYAREVHVGLSGGIGTPEAVLAAFMLGADFVLTGSINQCTVEAAQSDVVKEMLQRMAPHDAVTIPAEELLRVGTRMHVLRKGSLYAANAQALLEKSGALGLSRVNDGADHPAIAEAFRAYRTYCVEGRAWALAGDVGHQLDFGVLTGPALGSLNEVLRDTELESWRARHVDDIATLLMDGAAERWRSFAASA